MAEARRKLAEWREFENLVALIERHLSREGATVKSPDSIPDKVTGELREVDASIRYQVGSIPILITVECRKRSRKQDTRWIEQIARKRDDIGASVTVAVSSNGFSKPAIEKARFYGIETRLLRDVSETAILDWARKIDIIGVRGSFSMGRLCVRFKRTSCNRQPELHPDVKAGYAKGDVEYKFIRRIEDNTVISIGDLIRETEKEAGNSVYVRPEREITVRLPPESTVIIPYSSRFPSLFEDVPVGGEPVVKFYPWEFEPNEAVIETGQGPMEIEYLGVELNVIQRAYPANVGRLLSYENDKGPIANVGQRELEFGEGTPTIKVVVSGNTDDNQ